MSSEEYSDYKFKPYCFKLISRSTGDCPAPRSGHRLITDDKGNLYCYGGYNPALFYNSNLQEEYLVSLPLLKEVWKYNIAKSKWKKLSVSNIPDELVSCTLFMYSSNICVFGGTGYPFGAYSSNSVNKCSLLSDKLAFEQLEVKGELPGPQYGQGCVLDKNLFYTVGGTNGYVYNSDVHRLDLSIGVWEVLYTCTGKTNEPFGRYRHEIAYDGERIFLLGGGTVDLNANLDYIPVFYINNKKWDLVKSNADAEYGYPSARKYHSCVKLPRQLKFVIIGGYDDDNVYSDCWIIDLNTLSWKYLPTMTLPLATYFNSSAITSSGMVYTFGGVHHTTKNPERTNDMYAGWLGIPSLRDICWEAVKYYKIIDYFSKSQLRSLGLPLYCINEIE